jgi:hypothetical protein
LAIVKASPVKGAFATGGLTPVVDVRFSPSESLKPVPVLAITFQVLPDPVTETTEAPVRSVDASEKLLAPRPVTGMSRVTVHAVRNPSSGQVERLVMEVTLAPVMDCEMTFDVDPLVPPSPAYEAVIV